MNFLAPCGHLGVPIIGTYVSCLTCDGKAKRVMTVLPERFYITFFSGVMLLPSAFPMQTDLIITAIARPSQSKRFGFEVEPGVYTINATGSGMINYWRTCTLEYVFMAQELTKSCTYIPGSTGAEVLNAILEHYTS